ncbi:MFS transporter [Actinoplanes xinjiangensis]|uniref:MFS transporter n=1 Tax=Actinoplanes xinjiangensis TaxID=512350 RepID=UPI00343C135D
MTEAVRPATYREVFAEPSFRTLFVARTSAVSATSLQIFALSVLVYTTTESPLLSAVAFGAGFLPQFAGGLLLGSLTDRLRPRPLIVTGYAVEAVLSVVLALADLPVGVALTLVAAIACFTPVFSGAAAKLIAERLTGDAYVLGRAVSSMSSSFAQLLGLAGGGVAVAALGARHALLLAAAFFLSAAATVRLFLPTDPLLPGDRLVPGDPLVPADRLVPGDSLVPADRLVPGDSLVPADRLVPVDPLVSADRLVPRDRLVPTDSLLPADVAPLTHPESPGSEGPPRSPRTSGSCGSPGPGSSESPQVPGLLAAPVPSTSGGSSAAPGAMESLGSPAASAPPESPVSAAVPAPAASGGSVTAESRPDEGRTNAVRDSWTGATAMLADPTIRRLLLAQWLPSALVVGAEALLISYSADRGFPSDAGAVLMAGPAVGMLIGDFVIGRFVRPIWRERLSGPLVLLLGAPLLLLPAAPPLPVTAALLVLSGFGFAYSLGLQRAFLEAAPENRVGQMFALLSTGLMALQGVGPLLAGALAELTTPATAIACAGAATMLVAVTARKPR